MAVTMRLVASRVTLSMQLLALMAMLGGAWQVADAQQPQAPPPPPIASAAQTDVTGVWIDHTKRGAIEIVPCGQALCGYIYWVKDPNGRNGKPLIDAYNPDPARRGKPLCGTQTLLNVVKKGPAKIGNVWGAPDAIYDPEQGKRFDVELRLASADVLIVNGFIGIKMFGEQFNWTRAPADLVRCGPARV